MPDGIRTMTHCFGFDRADLTAIAAWWVESGQARWDAHADTTTLACEMEIREFVTTVVRENLMAIKAELAARQPKKFTAKIKR